MSALRRIVPSLGFILSTFIVLSYGQTTHTVVVGLEGSFYDPPTISAREGDTVTFMFAGDIHTVTQGLFESPCVPLPAGFNSGFAGKGTNGSAPTPTWDLHITNDTAPLWFFCQATMPLNHCEAGMVGAVNPPSVSMYNQFASAAKLAPPPTTTPTAPQNTGIGAFATGIPAVPTTLPVGPTGTTSSSPTSPPPTSLAPPPAVSTSSSNKSQTAVLGGAIGGGIGGAILLIGIIFLIWRSNRRRSYGPRGDYGFGHQHEISPLHDPFQSPKLVMTQQEVPYSPPGHVAHALSYSSSGGPVTLGHQTSNGHFTVNPRSPANPHFLQRQGSFSNSDTSQPVTSSNNQETPELQDLAREVARVLIRNQDTASQQVSSPLPQASVLLALSPLRRPSKVLERHVENNTDTPDIPARNSLETAAPSYSHAITSRDLSN